MSRIVMMICLVLLSACVQDRPAIDLPPSPPAVPAEGFELRLSVSPSPARVGTPLTLTLTLVAAKPLRFSFRNGQRYEFEVFDASGARVWQWSEGKLFIQVLGEERLEAGDRLEYQESWTPETPGRYRASGTITADAPASAESTFEISRD